MINFEWHDVKTPLFVSLWVVLIMFVQIIFHASRENNFSLPDSVLLIITGFCVGTAIDWFLPHDIYMDPDLFFLYLLPPIALEAGYFMPNRAFFRNIGTILTFAVFGTLWNIATIGLVLWLFSPFYDHSVTPIDIMLFSTLISAVDPVAVLSVFTEVKVNE
uniref:Cation/H+ exchanger domain-containing protein n=1 Tax=Acrobeloides nanus TaxID=290746 RepID=A0A914EIB7_9BILA